MGPIQQFTPKQLRERYETVLEENTYQGILFPRIHEEYKRSCAAEYTPAGLEAFRRARLEEALRHAGEHVPHYRALIARNRVADPLGTLRALPLLDKETVRKDPDGLLSGTLQPDRCRVASTSGTSGIPLRFVVDEDHLVHTYAARVRMAVRFTDRLHYKLLMPYQGWLQGGWFEYVAPGFGLARMAEFGTTAPPGPEDGDLAVRASAYAPDIVFGHPSSCLRLATALAATGRSITPRAVMTFGERLLPGARETLAQAYGAPVTDSYGMREFGTIAAQCAQDAYHIEAERLWVEVVDAEGVPRPLGERGELVVSNLVNRAMPLLRYRTGDVGALDPEPCGCGSPFPVLRLIEGRETSGVTLPSGRTVSGGEFSRVVRTRPVARFQLALYGDELLELRVLPAGYAELDTERLAEELTLLVAGELPVRVREVRAGEFAGSGERKHVDIVRLPADEA
ncbi:phenylacetate--CoA ligase family protein [Streptomyces sp. TG1A-8]|uniref:phenylacetate--CoA ligase family protein n=1 Tax=Streptomyces sp. TG1A-8 TaxID=3051385 RepID=UPI00265C078A|nr:phenylacetate--CoA ligase family protein [Streptomyces sp. TG1A-8]MDO0924995.1 phenylacetate--CoA ligase family protein [Streptomyces sp. TG1A-8]